MRNGRENVQKLSVKEQMLSTFLLGIGLYTMARGIFWVTHHGSVVGENDFYVALNNLIPIVFWGIILFLSGILLAMSSWFIIKDRNSFHRMVIIGGLANFVVYLFMAGASLYNASVWITTVQFVVLSGVNLMLALLGGRTLYERRK